MLFYSWLNQVTCEVSTSPVDYSLYVQENYKQADAKGRIWRDVWDQNLMQITILCSPQFKGLLKHHKPHILTLYQYTHLLTCFYTQAAYTARNIWYSIQCLITKVLHCERLEVPMSLICRDGREGGGATDMKIYTNSIMHRHIFLRMVLSRIGCQEERSWRGEGLYTFTNNAYMTCHHSMEIHDCQEMTIIRYCDYKFINPCESE